MTSGEYLALDQKIVPQNKDRLFAHRRRKVSRFAFDESVAAVFDDMIRRSVPGYQSILRMISHFIDVHARPASCLYDLGASLGAVTQVMHGMTAGRGCRIVAVDNSPAMVSRLESSLGGRGNDIEIRCEDVLDTTITNASVVVLNLVMQFIDPADRERLLQRIYQGLIPGGILILTEKISFSDPDVDARMTEQYYAYKRMQGYSEMEIAQKRTALENVLICDTKQAHLERLERCGFEDINVWFQVLNFLSLVARKCP